MLENFLQVQVISRPRHGFENVAILPQFFAQAADIWMQIMVGPAIIRSPNLGEQFVMRNNSVQAVRQLNVSMENDKEACALTRCELHKRPSGDQTDH